MQLRGSGSVESANPDARRPGILGAALLLVTISFFHQAANANDVCTYQIGANRLSLPCDLVKSAPKESQESPRLFGLEVAFVYPNVTPFGGASLSDFPDSCPDVGDHNADVVLGVVFWIRFVVSMEGKDSGYDIRYDVRKKMQNQILYLRNSPRYEMGSLQEDGIQTFFRLMPEGLGADVLFLGNIVKTNATLMISCPNMNMDGPKWLYCGIEASDYDKNLYFKAYMCGAYLDSAISLTVRTLELIRAWTETNTE